MYQSNLVTLMTDEPDSFKNDDGTMLQFSSMFSLWEINFPTVEKV